MLRDSVLKGAGNVSLIQLKKLFSRNAFVKAEFLNPDGSMKARVANLIIESAEELGKPKPGMIVLNK
jgi:cysteine synthase A